jgi:hypothetical protein
VDPFAAHPEVALPVHEGNGGPLGGQAPALPQHPRAPALEADHPQVAGNPKPVLGVQGQFRRLHRSAGKPPGQILRLAVEGREAKLEAPAPQPETALAVLQNGLRGLLLEGPGQGAGDPGTVPGPPVQPAPQGRVGFRPVRGDPGGAGIPLWQPGDRPEALQPPFIDPLGGGHHQKP